MVFSFKNRKSPVTSTLVTLSVISFCISIFTPTQYLEPLIAYNLKSDLSEWYQVFTHTFLHVDSHHLFGNMALLLLLGNLLEEKMGTNRFISFYFLTAFFGLLLHSIFTIENELGASGAIYGLIGASLMYCPNFEIGKNILPFSFKLKWFVLYFIIAEYSLIYNEVQDNVAHYVHIGGFISGIIISTIFNYKNIVKSINKKYHKYFVK